MPLIKLLASQLLPLSVGYLLIKVIFTRYRLPVLFTLSLGYGLGMGIIAVWMLALSIIGSELSFRSISCVLLILGLPLLGIHLFNLTQKKESTTLLRWSSPNEKSWTFSSKEKIFLQCLFGLLALYIVFYLYYAFWRALHMPIYTWDALATVAFKAKVFFYEGSLARLAELPHPDYPLFLPFIEAWVAFTLGAWDEQLIKIIFPLACLSFLGISYCFLNHYTNKFWALIGCALFASSNFFIMHATISYRDFFLMYYFCTALMLLFLWFDTQNRGLLFLAAIFAGITPFVKAEGVPYSILLMILFFILNFSKKPMNKQTGFQTILYMFPALIVAVSFYVYKNIALELSPLNAEKKSQLVIDAARLIKLPNVLSAFSENLFLSNNWGIVWFVLVLSLFHYFTQKQRLEVKLLLFSLAYCFGLYVVVSLFTESYRWLVGKDAVTSLSRVFLHFFPLSIYFIILTNAPSLVMGASAPEVAPPKPIPMTNFSPVKRKGKRRKR